MKLLRKHSSIFSSVYSFLLLKGTITTSMPIRDRGYEREYSSHVASITAFENTFSTPRLAISVKHHHYTSKHFHAHLFIHSKRR